VVPFSQVRQIGREAGSPLQIGGKVQIAIQYGGGDWRSREISALNRQIDELFWSNWYSVLM
jgi:hypothetical protein